MSAMQKKQFPSGISETDSAVTENGECTEESEIPVACQRVEACEELEEKKSIIKWSGPNKKYPLVHFSSHVLLLALPPESKAETEKYHLTYKFVKTECKLVRSILGVHCFKEVHPNSSNFNLMWTGSHIKPHTLRGLQDFQKVNHFPRSYELTRKDKLYKNIQRMQHSKGVKHFDFIPESYIIPEEFNEFSGKVVPALKMIFFSCSRVQDLGNVSLIILINGIFLHCCVASGSVIEGFNVVVLQPSHVPLDDNLLVCKYISNPLLVDGFKFDLRLYVGVTCFDPLRVYLYEEGLTRFATVKYDSTGKNIKNVCMHLTNYSVNKKNADFVRCPDPEVEDYGNKWSMSAMLRYLKHIGKDTTALMMRIEDVVVKTIIAGELHIASACKMFMPSPGNCFEIYGFDILIDENLRPWLLEVNLSPSLACDSPLDLKIKSHLVSDMFNLTGFVAHDPMVRKLPNRRFVDYSTRNRSQASVKTSLTDTIKDRIICYERKLDSWSPSLLRTKNATAASNTGTHDLLAKPRDEAEASRVTPEGYLATNYTEEKPAPLHGDLKHSREPDSVPAHRLSSSVPQPPPSRPSHDATIRALKPPLPINAETVSKQVLSKQARYQPIRADDLIAKAGTLTKLQARQAFAMYLQRVQQRLVHETSYDSEESSDAGDCRQDDQMNLVIRFLKKAASNLQQPFKVVVPSHKLPLHDRRRILAKQLGDFVRVYGKETMQIQKRQEINRTYGLSRSNSFVGDIPDDEFKVFMAIASETELEDLLTTYTKLNKNGNVFLGGNHPERSSEESTNKAPSHDPGLSRRKETERHSWSDNTTPVDRLLRPTDDLNSTGTSFTDRHSKALTAVAAYGASVALNKSQQRPLSAKVHRIQSGYRQVSPGRPVSAKPQSRDSRTSDLDDTRRGDRVFAYGGRVSSAPVSRELGANNGYRGHTVADEHAVATALQRLAKRQAARQYSALNTSTGNGQKWEDLFRKMDFKQENGTTSYNQDEFITVGEDVSDIFSPVVDKVTKPVQHDRHSSANATFETFVNHDRQHLTTYESTANQGHFNTAGARCSEERTIRVDLKRGHAETNDFQNEGKPVNVQVKSPSVSREEYNRQMRLISQKLTEEKFRLQKQLQQYPCLPRPPPARPNPGAKKSASPKRTIR
ncbi:PREDICTED: tubulin polyglutamylase TTLL5-like [Acropora digitifera]|uniref:tubulin polyglutamylase TTLL5-like n=1 Tax=Acropora digitifera TaxID=70779 RepID=UPI00077A226E|nr:PREDICTED: tubulin polyglutamylase TTLL5-like [Acropora digitifera]